MLSTKTWTRGRAIAECKHSFKDSTSFFIGRCCVCQKGLGMRSMKCDDCEFTVHHKCSNSAPSPCVPYVSLSRRGKENLGGTLAGYCPEIRPMIPPLVIRCVYALDKGYINGLPTHYRSKGDRGDRSCDVLMEALSSSCPPVLNNQDSSILVACLKRFLTDLKEPVISSIPFNCMLKAVSGPESAIADGLMKAMRELPIPNRDTLAYLLLHWKKVCTRNAIPVKSGGLVAVFGALLMEKSSRVRSENVHVLKITSYLLQLDTEFLESFTNPPLASKEMPSAVRTPTSKQFSSPSRAR